MKHRIWIVSLLCAVLLLGSCPALAEDAPSPSLPEGDGYQITELDHALCSVGYVTLSLDSFSFSPCTGLSLLCTATNAQAEGAVSVLLSDCVADGLCLPLDMGAALIVEPGESRSFVTAVTSEGAKALSLLGVESVAGLSARYRVLNEDNKILANGLSAEIPVPGGLAPAAYVPEGEPLYYRDGLRVYSLGFDEASGQAALLLEKTVGGWRALRLDAVFDGVREERSRELPMKNGQRRVCAFSAGHPVGGVDIYCSPAWLSSLSAPVRLTLGSPAPLQEAASEEEPLWSAGDCEIRFAGVSDSYFSDSDAMLFEYINRSPHESYWLYPSGDRVYLDGVSMGVSTTGAQCYPGTTGVVAVAVDALGAPDLSEYETLELALELYTLGGSNLKSEYRSEDLSIALEQPS